MDEFEEERIMMARRMARKLAHNHGRNRTIRKLPQSIVIVKTQGKRALAFRRAINAHKRLTYIILLGATLCAYVYDLDSDTLEFMMRTVSHEAHHHLPGIELGILDLPGVS